MAVTAHWIGGVLLSACLLGASALPIRAQSEPALPPGLGDTEPTLPAGLGGPAPALPPGLDGDGPALPPGLGESPTPSEAGAAEALPRTTVERWFDMRLPFRLTGFLEGRIGARVTDDPNQHRFSIQETRLQLEVAKFFESAEFHAVGDFVYDGLADQHDVDLETGQGAVDLREANLVFSPLDSVDVKIGRQILTWGTGDLVFINDLFPKDFKSFFIGRDAEYLKAPSDAVKLSAFSDLANLDVVYTPRFDADRFIDGRRVSFFDTARGRIVGRNAIVDADKPDRWFRDDEIAVRLYRNLGAYETALYGYHGFWKNPQGADAVSGRPIFPDLSVYGASVRGPVLGGIGTMEVGWYDSRDDRDGTDPLVRNSEVRGLIGYERELVTDLTMGLQYVAEHRLDHDAFEASQPPGSIEVDRTRHLLTQRLTWLTHAQDVTWSLFTFFSPNELDAYLRPNVSYKLTDAWTLTAGGNVFVGRDDHSFFGQFEDATNLYAGARFSF